jgi:hypothetical protein
MGLLVRTNAINHTVGAWNRGTTGFGRARNRKRNRGQVRQTQRIKCLNPCLWKLDRGRDPRPACQPQSQQQSRVLLPASQHSSNAYRNIERQPTVRNRFGCDILGSSTSFPRHLLLLWRSSTAQRPPGNTSHTIFSVLSLTGAHVMKSLIPTWIATRHGHWEHRNLPWLPVCGQTRVVRVHGWLTRPVQTTAAGIVCKRSV